MAVQAKVSEKKRISPRVDRDVARLAKSKAVAQDITLEWAVEQLLRKWVAGEISLINNLKSREL